MVMSPGAYCGYFAGKYVPVSSIYIRMMVMPGYSA